MTGGAFLDARSPSACSCLPSNELSRKTTDWLEEFIQVGQRLAGIGDLNPDGVNVAAILA